MVRSTPRAGKAGFTTIELMVSLVVFGLFLLAAVSTLSFGKRLWTQALDSSKSSIETAELVLLRQTFLAVVPPVKNSGGGLAGSTKRVRFLSNTSFDGTLFQRAETTVEIAGGQSLISTVSEDGRTRKAIRLKQVKLISFDYFGKAGTHDEREWNASWEASRPIPDLIKVDLRMIGERQAYSIYIALQN